MKRRGVFAAVAAVLGCAAAGKAVGARPAAARAPEAEPVPVGTILWMSSGAPMPAGWAQMDPPPSGGWVHSHALIGSNHHGHTIGAEPCHSHSVCDPGHSHGMSVAPFVRIIRIA